MNHQLLNSIEHFHELFYQYLMEKLEGDQEEVNSIIQIAEDELPSMLKEYFGTNLKSIYELQDENEISELRKSIKTNAVLNSMDREKDPRYTEVLRQYRFFVKSLQMDLAPIPVPGEENDFAPDSEGVEHQYNLTKKERNPDLRRKCIEYYKKQWYGHIHCICCGFNFSKAYGDIGGDYIEIHHVNPHHSFDGEHVVDPTKDLIPLCSNCHSMIHRVKGQGECMTLEELKKHYKGVKYKD